MNWCLYRLAPKRGAAGSAAVVPILGLTGVPDDKTEGIVRDALLLSGHKLPWNVFLEQEADWPPPLRKRWRSLSDRVVWSSLRPRDRGWL